MLSLLLAALDSSAPYWDPFAVLAGALVGFILGGIVVGLIALRLKGAELLAGSGRLARLERHFSQPGAPPVQVLSADGKRVLITNLQPRGNPALEA